MYISGSWQEQQIRPTLRHMSRIQDVRVLPLGKGNRRSEPPPISLVGMMDAGLATAK